MAHQYLPKIIHGPPQNPPVPPPALNVRSLKSAKSVMYLHLVVIDGVNKIFSLQILNILVKHPRLQYTIVIYQG